MTDRVAGYVVTLENGVREDADDEIVNALMMVKGVVGVEPVVESTELHMAKAQLRHEWRTAAWEFFKKLGDS
jgi:hypothetical protein